MGWQERSGSEGREWEWSAEAGPERNGWDRKANDRRGEAGQEQQRALAARVRGRGEGS